MQNRLVSISYAGGPDNYTYDGDGKRVKKISGGQTTLYINKYFERNLTTSENTTYYYLGGKMVAMRKGSTLSYIYQDHLAGTSVTDSGTVETVKYYPYGSTRSGSVPTDKKFTGQRLDGTGLYYYGAITGNKPLLCQAPPV